MIRTAYGFPRSSCACDDCKINCRFIPGFLIPSDLDRLIPSEVMALGTRAILKWAEDNLLASPGAIVANTSTGSLGRIPTLVPAVKPDGSCIHLTADERCAIHDDAPFGCAFFSCQPEPPALARFGLLRVQEAGRFELYGVIWRHLKAVGKIQHPPEVLRARMAEAL